MIFTPPRHEDFQVPPNSLCRISVACLAVLAAPAPQGARTPSSRAPARDARTDIYGDPLPQGALARFGSTRLRHGGAVVSLAFTPDGKSLVSAGDTPWVRLWEVSTGREVGRFRTAGRHARYAALSPDGSIIAAGGVGGAVHLWDVESGMRIRVLPEEREEVRFAVFSPDGSVLATLDGAGTVALWSVRKGKVLRRLGPGDRKVPYSPPSERGLAFSPDGRRLAAGGDSILIWALPGGEILQRVSAYRREVRTLQFAPDGDRFATACGDRTIRIWNARTGRPAGRLLSGPHSAFAFAPDGETMAASWYNRQARILRVSTGEEISRLGAHPEPITALAYSPDGKRLAVAREDGTIRIWDVAARWPLPEEPAHETKVTALAFSREGETLAVGTGGGTIHIWDVASSKRLLALAAYHGPVLSLAFLPGGETLASTGAGGDASLWKIAALDRFARLEGHAGGVTAVAASPNGTTVASGGQDKIVRIWNAETGEEIRSLRGHEEPITCLAYSEDGRLLASGSRGSSGGRIRIWDTETGAEIRSLPRHPEGIETLSFDVAGEGLVSLGGDLKIRFWDLSTGQIQYTLDRPEGTRGAFAISRDWGTLIRDHRDPPGMVVWEASTGRDLLRIPLEMGSAGPVLFSPDGKAFAAASPDTSVVLWDLDPAAHGWAAEGEGFAPPRLETLWAALAGEDGAEAHRAIWTLGGGGEDVVQFLAARVLASLRGIRERIPGLILRLDHDEYAVREAAMEELRGMETMAFPGLREALRRDLSPEVRIRIRTLLASPGRPYRTFPNEAVRHFRALQVLELIGTAKARETVGVLKGDPAGRLWSPTPTGEEPPPPEERDSP